MKFLAHHAKNGRCCSMNKMKAGIIQGDIDLARRSDPFGHASPLQPSKRFETNAKLQSIGGRLSKMNEKMKLKQNIVF